jgi:hypothetical protein
MPIDVSPSIMMRIFLRRISAATLRARAEASGLTGAWYESWSSG